MKIKPGVADPTFSAYVEMMADEIRKQPKRAPVILSEHSQAERDAIILAMQSPSTRRTLERPRSQDAAWLARPIPLEARIAKSADDMDQYIRPLPLEQVSHIEAIRRRPKNSLGQSECSGVSFERRAAAVNAFTFSPPATLTAQERDRIQQIAPYSPPPPLPPEEAKPSWLQRLRAWFSPKNKPWDPGETWLSPMRPPSED